MRSRFAFKKNDVAGANTFSVVCFFRLRGDKAVKSDPVAKGSGIKEVREVKPSPQSTKKETQQRKSGDGRFIAYEMRQS